jgi:hypothetical protein
MPATPGSRRRATLAVAVLVTAAAAGCGNQLNSLIAPTVSVTVTETFTGTLTTNGATSHPFSVTSTGGGDVVATLKGLTPDSSAVVGFGMGTWNGTSCQVIISNDRATQTASMLGRATSPGVLCIRLFDIGQISGPQDYEVEVVHP